MNLISFIKKNLFFLFHAVLFLALGIYIFLNGFAKIDFNLYNIIPEGGLKEDFALADKTLASKTSKMLTVLVSSKSFESARDAAKLLYTEIKDDSAFDSVSIDADESYFSSVKDFVFANRALLLSKKDVDDVFNRTESFCNNSLARAYAPFSLVPFNETDPFMLTEVELKNLSEKVLSFSSNLSSKDSVLFCEQNGIFYVLLTAILSDSGAAMSGKNCGAAKIFSKTAKIQKEFESSVKDLRFYFSGVPFHSYESSSNAQKEISIISILSVIFIILLLIFSFRDFRPVLFTGGAIFLSVLSAVAGEILFFGKMHILSFVFGTTLIGTCVDYSIHYFAHNKVSRSMGLSLFSTLLCYILFIFAPFNLLRQVAVFSIFGLLSSYVTVSSLFVKFKFNSLKYLHKFDKRISSTAVKIILIICIIFVIVFNKNISVHNDIRNLYTMSKTMLEGESVSARIMNRTSSTWYFIVKASSPEELSVKEEKFCRLLDKEIAGNNLDSYIATSNFIPSAQLQRQSLKAMEHLSSYAQNQYELLGYEKEESAVLAKSFAESIPSEKELILMGKNIPLEIEKLCSSFWIGKLEYEHKENYYSAIMPVNPKKDESFFRKLAFDFGDVAFVNKSGDTSLALDKLSNLILLLFCIAFVLVFFILRFFYRWKTVLRICFVPVFVAVFTLSVYAVLGKPFEFFSVIGIVLVFGLGLDYIIYITEDSSSDSFFASALSFLTTQASFGALALSSFVPVHNFGLSVCIGLSAAFLSSVLLKK